MKIKKRQQSAKKLSGCIATTKKAYICGVALAADNKNVERRNALTRRNLVNFNDRGAVGQAFHPIRAWTAFIDSSIRFTRAFLAEYKSQAALFCALAKSDRGSRKTDRVGKKNEIKNHGRRRCRLQKILLRKKLLI